MPTEKKELNMRAKLKRRFSKADKSAKFDDYDEADEETQAYVEKQIEEAEKHGHEQGKPGSLLHRLISHGNKKTEDELRKTTTQQGQGSSS